MEPKLSYFPTAPSVNIIKDMKKKIDLSKIEQWLHPEQVNGYIQGRELYAYLKDNNLLDDCLTRDDLVEIQKLGLEEFNKYFKDKWVYAWKSVQVARVPCLVEDRGRVVLHEVWLGSGWDAGNPALRRKSDLSPEKLETLETLPLELEINGIKYRKV